MHTYNAASLVAAARAVQGQLELVLASAGVAELEEVNEVIILLPCILLSLVCCTLALRLFALSVVSLLASPVLLIYSCVLCHAAGDLCFPRRLWAASRR